MPITGDRISGTITITSIAETLSPFNNYKNGDQVEQWKMEATPWWNTKYPWFIYKNMYTEDRDGELEENDKPTMGRHQVLLGVGKLGKEEYDGQQLWMWNMWLDVLDYDGPESAGTSTQPSRQPRTEAQQGQQGQQAQPSGVNEYVLGQRFGNIFTNAVNMTLGQMGEDENRTWPADQFIRLLKDNFPRLVVANDDLWNDFLSHSRDEEPVAPLNDVDQFEQELQNQEVPQRDSSEARALPTQTQPQLATEDVENLGWDDVPKKEQEPEGWVVPPNEEVSGGWAYEDSYEGFKQAYRAAGINMTQIKKAFDMKTGQGLIEFLETWCLETGKGYEDAWEHLQEAVKVS